MLLEVGSALMSETWHLFPPVWISATYTGSRDCYEHLTKFTSGSATQAFAATSLAACSTIKCKKHRWNTFP